MGAGFGLAAAELMQVCGVAGSVSWLVGAPPADMRLCCSSFRFCRVGPGWPAPIHVPGDRRRHDRADFLCRQFFDAIAAAPGSPIPAVVLSKMVLTVSTFTSAVFGAFCAVRRSNKWPSFRSAKCHPRSLGRSFRCCSTHHSRHTLTACAGRLS